MVRHPPAAVRARALVAMAATDAKGRSQIAGPRVAQFSSLERYLELSEPGVILFSDALQDRITKLDNGNWSFEIEENKESSATGVVEEIRYWIESEGDDPDATFIQMTPLGSEEDVAAERVVIKTEKSEEAEAEAEAEVEAAEGNRASAREQAPVTIDLTGEVIPSAVGCAANMRRRGPQWEHPYVCHVAIGDVENLQCEIHELLCYTNVFRHKKPK